jgi:ADP-heptose:LPS heptosyltransferase
VFDYLQIYDPRERLLVGAADLLLSAAAAGARLIPPWRRTVGTTSRILLLRLERIGDLLMSAHAIQQVRTRAPDAEIDLVVGSWNAPVAKQLAGPTRVEMLDAPWLARDGAGATTAELVTRARSWRGRRYDLAINFEGDIRSHALMALSGARRRVGFDMAGGGPLLTTRVGHRRDLHTADNAARLVAAAFEHRDGRPEGPRHRRRFELARHQDTPRTHGVSPALSGGDTPVAQGFSPAPSGAGFRLRVPDSARRSAAALLRGAGPIVAIHPSGGRAIKQWDVARFAEVGSRLVRERGTLLVLTGTSADAHLVRGVRARLPSEAQVIDLSGNVDLLVLAAVLERCDLLITGDTGPMHLAAAVGAPVVAVFGPSDPVRYAPRDTTSRIVRIDLPCAPCNRIRLPPVRCQGHTPDCLAGITADMVYGQAIDLLDHGINRINEP